MHFENESKDISIRSVGSNVYFGREHFRPNTIRTGGWLLSLYILTTVLLDFQSPVAAVQYQKGHKPAAHRRKVWHVQEFGSKAVVELFPRGRRTMLDLASVKTLVVV